MFQVGRYDPRFRERKKESGSKATSEKRNDGNKSGWKRKRLWAAVKGSSESNGGNKVDGAGTEINDKKNKSVPASSLHVIAPDVSKPALSVGFYGKQPPSKVSEEAFDDLDLVVEELIDDDDDENPPAAADDGVVSEEHHDLRRGTATGDDAATRDEIRSALRVSSTLSIRKAAEEWKLAPFLIDCLERNGFERFFPIQALSIPDVIASERHAHIRARDVCIAAPTGSGKTLAYALPILNSISSRKIRRLRALVILPSRDLATQVYRVFQRYTEGSDLSTGLAIGQTDFKAEQVALTVDDSRSDSAEVARHRLAFDRGNLDLALRAFKDGKPQATTMPKNGRSNVDILVCTPGRLMDHLDNTPGFTLQHLLFLVVDEADRLLSQSYHNWIGRVIDSSRSASTSAWRDIVENGNRLPDMQMASHGCSYVVEPITWRRGGTSGDDSEFNNNDSYFSAGASACRPVQLRKFLVSATLTRDPQKLASLRLVNPKHFDVHRMMAKNGGGGDKEEGRNNNKYSMPEGLEEYTVECTAEQKPLVLLALLLEKLQAKRDNDSNQRKMIIAVFTASLDATHRLARLLQLLWATAGYGDPGSVVEFSSALNQKERSDLVRKCNDPADDEISVVVCSDGMSRGMDIAFVQVVVNYDVPVFAKTYVHRCGRCARAGKKGTAISLLKGGQVGQFSKVRRLILDPARVRSIGVKKHLVRDAVSNYRYCVRTLREVLDAEEHRELGRTEVLSEGFLDDSKLD